MESAVCFHPVSQQELQRFVFDVIEDPTLLDARLAELNPSVDTWEEMRALYERTLRFVDEELGEQRYAVARTRQEDGEDDADEQDDEEEPHGVRELAVAVASCRHPYSMPCDAALQDIRRGPISRMFRPLAKIGTGRYRQTRDARGTRFSDFWEASGFIRPRDVRRLATMIEDGDPILLEAFGAESLESLRAAVAYAMSHGLGLMEARAEMLFGDTVLRPQPSTLPTHDLTTVHVDTTTPLNPLASTTANVLVRLGLAVVPLFGAGWLAASVPEILFFLALSILAVFVLIAIRKLRSSID
jgi:hypothetical protein